MTKRMLCLLLLAVFGGSIHAQDISGNWQGTLKAGIDLRIILEISKGPNGALSARLYSIDQGPDAIPVSSIALQGSDLKLTVEAVRGSYIGKLSPEGQTITGTWT